MSFDTVSLSAIEQLRAGGDARSTFAIIDLANRPEHATSVMQRLTASQGRCILGDLRVEAQLASPWLLRLGREPQDHAQLEWTLEWARSSAAVTWLRSELDGDELVARLLRRTQAMLPEQYPVLLRYFDPRVLPVLYEVLSAQQRAEFFALGASWYYLDRFGGLRALPMEQPQGHDMFSSPLQLDDAQSVRLLAAAEIDSVMPELVKEHAEQFTTLVPAERVRFTQRWLCRADELRLESFAERVLLCSLALQLGEGFDQSPNWKTALEAVAQGKMKLLRAIEAVQEQEAVHANQR